MTINPIHLSVTEKEFYMLLNALAEVADSMHEADIAAIFACGREDLQALRDKLRKTPR